MPEPVPFDPTKHFMKISGREYLEIKWRLVWFHQNHPDGIIATELIEHNHEKGYAIVRAVVSIPGKGSASGLSMHAPTTTAKDYVANAETSAIGRALAILGFGTQHAIELDEPEQLADSPVQRPKPIRPAVTAAEVSGKPEPACEVSNAATRTAFRDVCRAIGFKVADVKALTIQRSKGAVAAWEDLDQPTLHRLVTDLQGVKEGRISLQFKEGGIPVFSYPPAVSEAAQ